MRALNKCTIASAAVFAVSACSGAPGLNEATYQADQCHRVPLIDANSGDAVIGAEDFAIDRTHDRLFIAAYDRVANERAAKKRGAAGPSGGIFTIDVQTLLQGTGDPIDVRPLVSADEYVGGLRPHGISFDPDTRELAFINRAYSKSVKGRWQMVPSLKRIGADGEMIVSDVSTTPCHANDVLLSGENLFASFDHGACDWRAGIEDVFQLKRSGIAQASGQQVFGGVAFANGLAQTPGGLIALAATREKNVILMHQSVHSLNEHTRIKVPGAPDNITISDDGHAIVATHPSLFRLALNRKMNIGKAPSRIVKLDTNTGKLSVLFDDPSGEIFSAATVGVQTQGGLILGSVTDHGVLVCPAPS